MRTLSARILLGFAALTIAFGVITAWDVYDQQVIEDEVKLVRKGFLPLALISKDLARREEDLKSYLGESLQDDPNVVSARANLNRIHKARDNAVSRSREIIDNSSDLLPAKIRLELKSQVEQIHDTILANAPLYLAVYALPPLGRDEVPGTELMRSALRDLKNSEIRIANMANRLSEQLETRVHGITINLEENAHISRVVAVYLGIAAVALGLMMTIWVVITLRPLVRLRDGARRVAAGDYASRVDERGPSEVADLARELNTMAHAVEERERELVRSERLAAVGKIAAMITHEVRNPLSSIGLNTELLEDELSNAAGADEARQLCASIHREVDRLTAITEEYLALARLPKPKIAREAVNPIVGALAAFVREDLAARGVELAVDLGASEPVAMIDASQLRQCLINLVRNAADAVSAKGRGHVTLRTRRIADRVLISVEDDGVGVAPDALPKLFDPFFSTKEGGSGLGLALTQQIVKDHDGDLAVDSTVGKGTTFTVSVPASG